MKLVSYKLLLSIILTTLTTQTAIAAQILFDLNAQHFSETLNDGGLVAARYNLPDSFVSTNLKYDQSYHSVSGDDTGSLAIELKQPIENWGVSFDIKYSFSGSFREKRSIKLTSDDGTTSTVSLSWHKVTFNGIDAYEPENFERLVIAIDKNNNEDIKLRINGDLVASTPSIGFSNLKFVEVQLISENGLDSLNSLIIGEK